MDYSIILGYIWDIYGLNVGTTTMLQTIHLEWFIPHIKMVIWWMVLYEWENIDGRIGELDNILGIYWGITLW